MGKSTGQLAGLAALGALGYMLSQDKKGEAPAASRSVTPSMGQTPSVATQAELDYPDESRRGRMATRPEDMAPVRAAAPGPSSARNAAPASGEPAGMENYVPRDRYARSTTETPAARATTAASAPSRAASTAAPAASAASRPASAASAPAARPAGDMAAERGIREQSLALMRQARDRAGLGVDLSTPEGRARAEQAQALEEVHPEQYLMPGVGIKGIAALARNLANRGATRAAESTAPFLRELAAPTRALPAPVPRLPAPTYKKGGAVKAKAAVKKMASGGMTTSSASKRADGIAQRGKTRGKLY
jgi:hypothetical protein